MDNKPCKVDGHPSWLARTSPCPCPCPCFQLALQLLPGTSHEGCGVLKTASPSPPSQACSRMGSSMASTARAARTAMHSRDMPRMNETEIALHAIITFIT
ncbi:MAG: hypothetical protein GYA24_14995 [Candidatus Lokiarchaeota archaeon]|nr:hypothetical protein [Candidatus Lokiarchaeota archaeon]